MLNISYYTLLFTERLYCGINSAKNAIYPKQIGYTKHQAGQRPKHLYTATLPLLSLYTYVSWNNH